MTLLTLEEFHEFVETDMEDDALEVLLDAAESAIAALLGETDYLGENTVIRDGGSRIIFLPRPGAVTTVTETIGDTVTELDPDDWLMRSDGLSVERLDNGPNAPSWWSGIGGAWGGRVTITFTPDAIDTLADQKRVQLGLVRLDLDRAGGATSFTIGAYSESGGTTASTYEQSRAALLDSLLNMVPETWSFA